MKKLFYLIGVLLTLFAINCVAINEAYAQEPTWYEEAAAEVNNPVLLEKDQYYEGVSINSHIISDLTFLQIPFSKFLSSYQSEKQMQIITFAEALYMDNDEVQNEVVMYLYVPKGITNIDSVQTKMQLLKQELLQEDGRMIEEYCSPLPNYHNWSKVSEYNEIIKFSFGTYKTNASAKKILLKEYNKKQANTLVSTEFDIKINQIATANGIVESYDNLVNAELLILNQEFNFIFEKNNDHPEAFSLLSNDYVENSGKTHFTTAIGYNETKAKTEGRVFRLRANRDLAEKSWVPENIINNIGDILFTNENAYADLFYYFFNVYDSDSGKKWTGDEVITKIDYIYYEYLEEYTHWVTDYFFGLYTKYDIYSSVSYLNKDGSIFAKDENIFDAAKYEEAAKVNPEVELFSYYNYREPNTLNSIYQTGSVEPETFKFKYPIAKESPSILDYLAGRTNDYYEVTMPTLFSTKDKTFVEDVSYNLYSDIKTSEYQYGMIIGEKAYVATSYDSKPNLAYLMTLKHFMISQFAVELVNISDIYYEYQGEKYHAIVTENDIDHSLINTPINPFDPDNPLFPTEKVPEPKTWWKKLIEFINKAIEWIKENYKVVIFVVASTIVISFVVKLIIKFKQYRASKIIIENANKQNRKRE